VMHNYRISVCPTQNPGGHVLRISIPSRRLGAILNRGSFIMSRLLISIAIGIGLGVGGCATDRPVSASASRPAATPVPMSKDAYDAAVRNAENQYRSDREACNSRSGNAKDVCVAEASGKEKVAKADAEAAYRATPKAREDARVTRAEAVHAVSQERCDDLAGNPKDVCVREADAALTKVKADAKVDRVAADTREDVAAKEADARRQAAVDKRDADYKVAAEKCDALSGSAKSTCISEAKLRYGK
jgi:hypothetical protein